MPDQDPRLGTGRDQTPLQVGRPSRLASGPLALELSTTDQPPDGQASCVLARDRFEWQGGVAMKTDLLKRITIEPGKCGGRPCIRGMRIRVTDILQLLSAGAPYEEILEDYPDLQREDILAAMEYAAHQTDHVVLQGV